MWHIFSEFRLLNLSIIIRFLLIFSVRCYHPPEDPPKCALCLEFEDLYYENLVRHLSSLRTSTQAPQRSDGTDCDRLLTRTSPRWLRRNPYSDSLTVDPPELSPSSLSNPNRRAFIVISETHCQPTTLEYCSRVVKSNSHRQAVKLPSIQH